MFGLLFYHELLIRAGRLEAFRRLYAGAVIIQAAMLLFCCEAEVVDSRQPPPVGIGHEDATIAQRYVEIGFLLFMGQQIFFLLVASPPFIAGAITDEKSNRTLSDVLTTDLTSWEIVSGKCLSRLAQVVWITLPGLPVILLIVGMLDWPWWMTLGLLASCVPPFFALGAACVLASVWSRQTRDAVMRIYAAMAIVILSLWALNRWLPAGGASGPQRLLGELGRCLNPVHILQSGWDAGARALLPRLVAATVFWSAFALACLAIAAWRLRPAYIKQLVHRKQRNASSRPTSPVNEAFPIIWKEREIERLTLLPGVRLLPDWSIYAVIALATTIWLLRAPLNVLFLNPVPGLVVLFSASLYVAARGSGSITLERDRHTWSLLLLTPLSNRELIQGKLEGISHSTARYLLAYGVPAVALGIFLGISQLVWTVGLLAITYTLMNFMGAVGVHCSLRCTSAWRSLLVTVVRAYIYMAAILLIASVLYGFIAAPIVIALQTSDPLIPSMLFIGYCFIVAFVFQECASREVRESLAWMKEREMMLNENENRKYNKVAFELDPDPSFRKHQSTTWLP